MGENTKAVIGHLASAGAYTIFAFNIIICKEIANAEVVTPLALFTLRALGATILFWLFSLFIPKEKIERKDFKYILIASFASSVTFRHQGILPFRHHCRLL